MNSRNIIVLFLILHFNNAINGMDMDIEIQKWHLSHTFGNDLMVNSVCFSPCNKFLAVSLRPVTSDDYDKAIHILEIGAHKKTSFPGKFNQKFLNYDSFGCLNTVFSTCFSPCGRYLATGSIDEMARIFDIGTQNELFAFKHNAAIYSTCFSPCGKLLATATQFIPAEYSENNEPEPALTRVFNIFTKNIIFSFDLDTAFCSVNFSSCGKFLATSSLDNKIRIFDIFSAKMTNSFAHATKSVCFSPCGKFLAATSEKKVCIFELNTWQIVAHLNHDHIVNSVCFSRCGSFLATGSCDGKVCVFSREQ